MGKDTGFPDTDSPKGSKHGPGDASKQQSSDASKQQSSASQSNKKAKTGNNTSKQQTSNKGGNGGNSTTTTTTTTTGTTGFSLTPGRAHFELIIDYKTKAGSILYDRATAKLADELYNCTPDRFYQFMKSVEVRGEAFGWTDVKGVCWIPITFGSNNKKNILTNYGMLSLERLTEHVLTWIHTET